MLMMTAQVEERCTVTGTYGVLTRVRFTCIILFRPHNYLARFYYPLSRDAKLRLQVSQLGFKCWFSAPGLPGFCPISRGNLSVMK